MYLTALFSILDLCISHLITDNVSWFTFLGGLFNVEETSSNFLGRVSLLPGLHCTTVLSWRKKYNGFLPAAGACGLFAVSLVFSLLPIASFQSMDTDGSLEAWICCLKEQYNPLKLGDKSKCGYAEIQIISLCEGRYYYKHLYIKKCLHINGRSNYKKPLTWPIRFSASVYLASNLSYSACKQMKVSLI